MNKLWKIYVSLMTDKIHDRITVGFVVAETAQEANEKLERWKRDKDPYDYVSDIRYDRVYKTIYARKNIKSMKFYACPANEAYNHYVIVD